MATRLHMFLRSVLLGFGGTRRCGILVLGYYSGTDVDTSLYAMFLLGVVSLIILLIRIMCCIFKRSEPEQPLVSFEEQSILELGPERIRTSRLYKNEALHSYVKDVRTLYDIFHEGAKKFNNGNCLGLRKSPNGAYVWQCYNDTILRAKNFGSGLLSIGLPPGQDSKIGTNVDTSLNAMFVLGVVSLIILLIWIMCCIFKRSEPEQPLVSFEDQSILEPGPERIRTSRLYKNEALHSYVKDVRTLYDIFHEGARKSNNGNCLGWRKSPNGAYVWQSYNDTILRAKNFGSGLLSIGLPPGQDSKIGIYLRNCPEWIMAQLAAFTYSMIVVALYDTLGDDSSSFIMDQTKMKLVICEDDSKVLILLKCSCTTLKSVITLKEVTATTRDKAKEYGVDIYTFNEVEVLGAEKSHPPVLPKPDNVSTICYTSGTTGLPKGVMLTHANLVASVVQTSLQFTGHWVNKDDVMLSFLPLAHMLQRSIEYTFYKAGGAVGFFSGDLLNLSDDIVALKPTILISVPRLLNKLYNKTLESASKSKLTRILFDLALAAKEAEVKRGIFRNNSIWDKLVFGKVQKSLGGRVRMTLISSAPLSENVLNFVRCGLGTQAINGYGQTECLLITGSLYGESDSRHCGPPVPFSKIKLVDVPEMDYYAAKDKGEICLKGPNVFKGYYKQPDMTREALDDEGWVHTGDIGEWLPNGALKLIDRKKHIFKLSQGEYIVPGKIENIYLRSHFVDQVIVHGQSLKSCVVAIVVPTKEALTDTITSKDIGGCWSFDDKIKRIVLQDMLQKGKEAKLKSFEQVKDIYLHPELFSIQNNLLTPTLKAKRREIIQHFQRQIDNMYKNLD